MDTVKKVGLEDYKRAAATLAEAFIVDPVTLYFCRHPLTLSKDEVQRRNEDMMEYITYAHILNGQVYQIGDFGAVALWMPPGENMDDLSTIFKSGMWRLFYKLSNEGRKRFFNEFFPLLHDTKAQVLGERDEKSWYLVYLGTRPSARGKGYARRLVEYVTDQADHFGLPTYLESSHLQNRPIYEKLGFEYIKSVFLTRALGEKHVADEGEGGHGEKGRGIEMEIMIREPRVVNGYVNGTKG